MTAMSNCGTVNVPVFHRDGLNDTSLKMGTRTHLWLCRGLMIILFFIKMPAIFLSVENNAFFPCLITTIFDYDVE
jgi:hypothetical protein